MKIRAILETEKMNKIKDFIVENSSGEMFVVGVVMYV